MSRLPALQRDSIRVLHVDDDEQMRTLLRDSLEHVEGEFDVQSVGDPTAALDLIDERVDCVVSDYEMPGMNGLELLRTVREEWPDLPFILLTGRGSESVASEAVSAGLTDYFRKSDVAGQFPVLAQRVETAVEAERAEVSYRELFRKAADGIALNDPETGAFVDANPVFREMLELDRSELMGMGISDIGTIPPQREQETTLLDRLRQAAREGATSTEECSRRADGERFWMELQFKPIEIKGSTFVLTQARQITDRKRYEQTLSALHAAVTEIVSAEKPRQVTGSVLSTVTDLLGVDRAVVFRHDPAENWLAVVDATSPDGVVTEVPLDPERPIARAFIDGEPVDIRDSVFERGGVDEPAHAAALPIGAAGVLVVEYDHARSFDDDQEFAQILTNAAAAAFERIEKAREAHSSKAALREQTNELQRLERLNATLRGLNETLLRTDTRAEVFEAVCDQLGRIEGIKLAWIGTPTDGKQLDRRAWAGEIPQYLDAVPLDLETSDEPAVVAVRTGTRVHVENAATGLTREPWRRAALSNGVESVMAVPIEVGGATDAVLSLLATDRTTFDEQFADLLSAVAATVGETLHSIEQRRGLRSDETVELEFDIPPERHLLGRLATSTGAEFAVQGVIPEPDGRSRVFLAVEGADPADVAAAGASMSTISEATVAADDDGAGVVELALEISVLGTGIREYALRLGDLSATSETVRASVDVARAEDVRPVVTAVLDRFDGSRLLAKRTQADTRSDYDRLLAFRKSLTSRQREVLHVAYLSGYFKSPRQCTGDDLAEKLGISSQAVYQHIRQAERALFEEAFRQVLSVSASE
ncbi:MULTISPECIES: bacterio-opsin activator domain-containing protein [Halolamina]|uniref:Response regulatory domain-containing protein n=1 Tax=Halolamina pelagica TaxID=699431 RepID=A0A1I5TQM1_9EURY|nr:MULTISPECIES: bacterio-opsin activator domain-containing protein [Halolamina]NHX37768.1 response regulator [Halolamina sp. R1-12]SFP85335.1 hypothetical protein SAMN05216277_11049 [Halolamina pelagica]